MEQQMQAANLTAKVYKKIRKEILRGTYKPGESLTELALTKSMEVSRTPVREALRQLEMEGLVELRPNRGAVVIGINGQDIEDIYAVRKALEIMAVEWAVSRISDEQIQALQEQSELMEFYTTKKDSDKVLELNSAYHDIIYDAAGSRFMAQILRSYKEYIEQTRKVILYEQAYLEEILKEHKAVLAAIKARDVDGAKKAMAEHLEMSQRRAKLQYNMNE